MRPRVAVLDPLIVGVLAAAVSLAGAGRPSFWYDEAATISASYSRSLGQLWQMLGNVDAVHGLYYLLMHGWFTIFPPTEFWSRVPSGLAVGGAAAGVVVLGKQFSSRTVAVSSGVICAILPRATWAGIEARPYALTMMVAAWSTVLLVHAVRRDSAWVWLLYGVAMATSILLDVYLALMLVAHAVFLCLYRPSRTVLVRFAITAVCACVAVAPFVLAAVGQAHQIIWISPVGRRTVEDVAVQQYFERSPLFMIVSACVVVTAVILWRFTSAQLAEPDRQLLILAIAWLVVPTALILGWSAWSIRSTRLAICASPHRRWHWCWASASARWRSGRGSRRPSLSGLRARRGAELSTGATQSVCEVRNGLQPGGRPDRREGKGEPGDCLLVNDTVTFMPAPMRPLLAARPDAYRKADRHQPVAEGDRPQRRLRHQPHTGGVGGTAERLPRRVDHHPGRPVAARPRTGPADGARPAIRRHPGLRGRPRPGFRLAGALAVQPGSGHQGDAMSVETVYQTRM